MQMYVGIVTLITLHVLSTGPKMATNGVRQCAICRTEVAINTKGNRISVECDMEYDSSKTTI